VLGVVPGLVGLVQANETLKLILGIGEPLIGRVLCVDALAMRFREIRLARDPDCPGCGPNPRPVGYGRALRRHLSGSGTPAQRWCRAFQSA
jgi:hypothetical protein